MALRSQAPTMMEDAAVAHSMLSQTQNAVKVSSTSLLYPVVIGLASTRTRRNCRRSSKRRWARRAPAVNTPALLSRYGLEAPTDADVQPRWPARGSAQRQGSRRHAFLDWDYTLGLLWDRDFWSACWWW